MISDNRLMVKRIRKVLIESERIGNIIIVRIYC